MNRTVEFNASGTSFYKEEMKKVFTDYLDSGLESLAILLEIDESERTKQFDLNAIKVIVNSHQIGWVPKDINSLVKMAILDTSVENIKVSWIGFIKDNAGIKISFDLVL